MPASHAEHALTLGLLTLFHSAEIVLVALDVVLAEIIAGLGLDKDQEFFAFGVFDAMFVADSDVDRFAGFDYDFAVV